MTMVMVQGEASTFVVDDPCAGMIIAHVKRDTDFVIGAFTDMHDNAFSAPGIIFLVFADDPPLESLSAKLGQAVHELCFP